MATVSMFGLTVDVMKGNIVWTSDKATAN